MFLFTRSQGFVVYLEACRFVEPYIDWILCYQNSHRSYNNWHPIPSEVFFKLNYLQKKTAQNVNLFLWILWILSNKNFNRKSLSNESRIKSQNTTDNNRGLPYFFMFIQAELLKSAEKVEKSFKRFGNSLNWIYMIYSSHFNSLKENTELMWKKLLFRAFCHNF